MNSEQCRVARAMLGWTVKQLSMRAKVNERTIRELETRGRIGAATTARIRSLFIVNGIEFIEDEDGIGLKRRFSLDEYISRRH